ncbi:Nuf2 family-domain-containing protein [Fomitopsis serialis]|uniref:Nuf2 family-domain-containing protein n=1 Tax=Fomitopsis serialis TaxID=139415 RepID=UPI0020082DB4|nr:Nuf2 family-domain-containing protein [Neoantrodia serialis]KAH9925307.1 Nuf2 family-domain-containing protein [Neoantrodia serialis]
MAGQFWFPSMSVPEIVDAFTGWGFSVSNEQVAHPTTDFVISIYSACLEQVTGIALSTLQTPLDTVLDEVENKDLYTQALSHNMLLHHLQRFANAARFHDFTAKDIYFPDPERSRSIFSAFINFVKFAEQCETFVSGLRERSASVIEERDRIAEQLVETKQKIEAIKAKRAEDEPKCDALRQENTSMTEQLIKYKETQLTLLKDLETLKQEIEVLLQRKEGINNETAIVTEKVNRTKSRIVQDPERIKRNIATMSATTAEDKKTVATHEGKIRDLQTKITALLNIEKDVRTCIEQLQVIEKETNALDTSQKALVDLRDQLDQKKGERLELEMRRERVHKQLSNAQVKLERAQQNAEEKRAQSQQSLERLQEEYEKMVVDRQLNDKKVEELRADADEIERQMAEHLKKSQAELTELLTEYWRLRHETEVYMETLANKLGMQVRSS